MDHERHASDSLMSIKEDIVIDGATAGSSDSGSGAAHRRAADADAGAGGVGLGLGGARVKGVRPMFRSHIRRADTWNDDDDDDDGDDCGDGVDGDQGDEYDGGGGGRGAGAGEGEERRGPRSGSARLRLGRSARGMHSLKSYEYDEDAMVFEVDELEEDADDDVDADEHDSGESLSELYVKVMRQRELQEARQTRVLRTRSEALMEKEADALSRTGRSVTSLFSVVSHAAHLKTKRLCQLCPYSPREQEKGLSWLQRARMHVHLIMEHPTSSRAAQIMSMVIMFCIVATSMAVVLETLDALEGADEWNVLDIVVVTIFTAEYLARLFGTRNVLVFHAKVLNIVDLFVILPYYLSLAVNSDSTEALRIVRLIRLARMFRVLNLPQFRFYSRILSMTLRNSAQGLVTLLFILVLLVIMFGGLMFYVDRGTLDEKHDPPEYIRDDGEPSPYQSVPETFWLVIVTLVSLGYGDVTPVSGGGKALAVLMAIVGIMSLALPMSITARHFQNSYRHVTREFKSMSELIAELRDHEYRLGRRVRKIQLLLLHHAEKDAALHEVLSILGNAVVDQLASLRFFLRTQFRDELHPNDLELNDTSTLSFASNVSLHQALKTRVDEQGQEQEQERGGQEDGEAHVASPAAQAAQS